MLRFLFWLIVFHSVLGLGISIGYHRLLTHRSFECPRWLERGLVTLGWLALMGGPISWVAVHRFHHAHADDPLDPHSPVQGGWWWSQTGWIAQRIRDRQLMARGTFQPPAREWPDSFTDDTPFVVKYARDIHQDRYYRRLTLTGALIWLPVTALACFIVGGWPMMMGRLVAAATIVWCTWYVNSYAHDPGQGYRNFETSDASRNVWWVALLTDGEGWHNNHHYRARSARHGMRWWEFDLSWGVIWALQRLGLATGVYACTYGEALASARSRTDGEAPTRERGHLG